MPDKKQTLPEIKKKISSYLSNEDGKITKESLMTIGAFVTGAAAASALLANSVSAAKGHTNVTPHDNNINLQMKGDVAMGEHSHHSSHNNVHNSY